MELMSDGYLSSVEIFRVYLKHKLALAISQYKTTRKTHTKRLLLIVSMFAHKQTLSSERSERI